MAIDDNTDYTLTGAQVKDLANKINDKAEATALTDGSVTKVGTGTVGGTGTPIYLNSGTPTAVSKPASGSWFKGVPDISSGGVMEVGKYIDFHNANTDTSDYAVRLQTQGNNQVAVNLPTASGTLALTSQLVTKTQLYSGGTSSTTTSALSQAPSNFQYLLIDLIDNDGNKFSRLVPAGNTYFTAVSHGYANNRIYAKWCRWQINGSTITRTYAISTSSHFYEATSESNNIGVQRVYGVKFP